MAEPLTGDDATVARATFEQFFSIEPDFPLKVWIRGVPAANIRILYDHNDCLDPQTFELLRAAVAAVETTPNYTIRLFEVPAVEAEGRPRDWYDQLAESPLVVEYWRLTERLEEADDGAECPLYWTAEWSEGPVHEVASVPVKALNCMFSPSRTWGLYFTDVSFALIGAPSDLLSRFESGLPQSFEEQERDLLTDSRKIFREQPPYLQPLLTRLHGDVEARARLVAAGFTV